MFLAQFQCLAAMCLAQGWPLWTQVLSEVQVRRLQDLPETDVRLSHSSCSLLACFSALAFAGRWFAVLRQGRVAQHEAACCTARVFSHRSSSMAQLLLYLISKASRPSEERPDPVDELQSHTCGLSLPSPVPAKRMGCRWPTWCQKLLLLTIWHAGFHPGGTASI